MPKRREAHAHPAPARPHSPLRWAARAGSRQLTTVVRAPFGDVPGPFPARRGIDTSLDDRPTPQQERGMRAFWWDGFWISAADSVLLNYLGLYLLAFGASNAHVGLLSSLSSLCAALAFFPGARAVEKLGRPKATVMVTGAGIARLAVLAFAAVPIVAGGSTAIWLVIAAASFRNFWGYFAIPAWTAITAETVPGGMRGRFLASRNFGMGVSALAMAPLAGLLIDGFTGMGGWQLVWLLAFAAGALSSWCYARIPEPPAQAGSGVDPTPDAAMRRNILADIASDRNFVVYLASVALWNLSLQAAGPFFNIYLVTELDASTAMVGLLAAIPALTGLAAFASFGRLMDRKGTKWLMSVTALLIPALPFAWIAVTSAWQVLFINASGGIVWAGYQLAAMNMVMVMAPPEKRARYAAAYQTVTFAGAFAGPLAGGALIAALGFKPVFFLSGAGRLAAALLLVRFVRAQDGRGHPAH